MVTVLGTLTVQGIGNILVMVGAADWIPYSLTNSTVIHTEITDGKTQLYLELLRN